MPLILPASNARSAAGPATIDTAAGYGDTTAGYGCIFRLGSDIADPNALPLSLRTALANADAVLHDAEIDPEISAMIRPDASIEAIPANGERVTAALAAIGRMHKLASEGWRVVWLASTDLDQPTGLTRNAPIHICGEVCTHAEQHARMLTPGPRSLATAFNGLAG
jgi:hypothetical protein